MEALRKEFARFSEKCWIERNRQGKRDVIEEAKATGEEVHSSIAHVIAGEKHLELPKGDERRRQAER